MSVKETGPAPESIDTGHCRKGRQKDRHTDHQSDPDLSGLLEPAADQPAADRPTRLADDALADWLRLIRLQGLSEARKRALVVHLGNPGDVLKMSAQRRRRLSAELGCDPGKLPEPGEGLTGRPGQDPTIPTIVIDRDLALLDRLGASFLPITSPDFPTPLANIDQPPLGLFYRGDPGLLSQPQLAIVGSRHASRSGLSTAEWFARELSGNGLLITSGLAAGIDSAAHRGALDAGQPTIAVTATGIDKIYPYANRGLFEDIVGRGLVVTEYPPGTPPRRPYFPQRNRIISGLAMGTLVVEASLRSGSLITARLASEQGREVFALPGSVHNAGSRGCHALIRQGAALVESPADILEELEFLSDARRCGEGVHALRQIALDRDQADLLNIIDFSPCPIDQIIAMSGLTADQVSSILVRLELLGLVSESAGGYQRLPH